VTRRGPEVGVFRIEDDFHGSRVNRIDLCLFIRSRKSGKLLLPPFQDLKKSIVKRYVSYPHFYIVFTAISMHKITEVFLLVVEHVNGKKKGTVMLYALSTCGWCARTKELLRTLGVDFDYTYVDLLEGKEQDDAMNEIEKWNPKGSFPTLVIKDKTGIVGFREEEIREALM
jgi:glutaredoxin-like protein NrdH